MSGVPDAAGRRPPVRVTFLGSGDAFGSGGRLQACLALTVGAEVHLLDCGASSMIALRARSVDPNAVRSISLTHLHGDHFGGLPFFVLDAQLYSRRTEPLTVCGPPGARRRVEEAQEVLFPGSSTVRRRFAIEWIEWMEGATVSLGAVAITPFATVHAAGAPAFALRASVGRRTVCYSGDTEWTPALAAAARGADLLVLEALSFEKPLKQHLSYRVIEAHRSELSARRIVLTHLGPEMLAHVASSELEAARDGMTIAVTAAPPRRSARRAAARRSRPTARPRPARSGPR